MKILILEHPRIQSEEHFNDIANTPLWSCLLGGYAAASLTEAGYDVDYMDTTGDTSFEDLETAIPENDYDLICINAVYMWENTEVLFVFLESLKFNGFSGHLNLFGFFPTLAYREILKVCPYIDSIAAGECEKSLVELAERIQSTGNFTNINGIACREDTRVVLLPRIPEHDPDIFPFPVRNARIDETAILLGSRGCYNQCSFCLVPPFYNNGPLWRGRSPENIIKEIKELKAKGYKDFYFADANFIGPGRKGKERIIRLLSMLSELNITYGMETRGEDIDEEIAGLLKSSGLTSLLIGIESGSGRILSGLSKHSDTDASERAINILRDAGIEPEAGFLMFVPDSSIEDIKKNFAFLRRNRLLDRLDRTVNLLCHRQIVLMGTSGYSGFQEEGRLVRKGFSGFEGHIEFKDKRVDFLCDIITDKCHSILKAIADSESEIYFSKDNSDAKQKVNDQLVSFFEDALYMVNTAEIKN